MSDLISDYWKQQPPIERRPVVTTPDPEVFNMSIFEKARRDRLADSIGDYLTDENCSARRAYEEILAEVKEWRDYHQENLDKANELYNLLLGHRECDIIACADSFASAE